MAATATKMYAFFWTMLTMAILTEAMWPVFHRYEITTTTMAPTQRESQNGSNNEDFLTTSSSSRSISSVTKQKNSRLAGDVPGSDVTELRGCTCVSEIQALDSRSRANQLNLQELRRGIRNVVGVVTSLQESVRAVSEEAQQKSAPMKLNVAFSARLGSSQPSLTDTEVIVFDEVLINNGDLYDPSSGKFTSPFPGLYQFQTTILSGYNDTIETMLVLNGLEAGRVFSGGHNTRGSGTNGVLLNLDAGDEVWVSVFFGNGHYVHGLWSTFSGHLVRGFDSDNSV